MSSSLSQSAEVLAESQPIYRHKSGKDGSFTLTNYYPKLNIDWKSSFDDNNNNNNESNDLKQWNVYVGDVVAVSTTDLSSFQEIKDWQPDHLASKSDHWKIGLVLALTQTIDKHQRRMLAIVQWLYKPYDRKDFHDHLVKSNSYRPYRKHQTTSQIPHMLLNSPGDIEAIDIGKRLLPVRIQMLEKKEFSEKGSVQHYDPDDPWDLQFFCCKDLKDDKIINVADPNVWAQFNPLFQQHNAETTTKQRRPVPRPMQQAWTAWRATKEIPELLQNLVRCFHEACKPKAIAGHNRLLEKQKQEQENFAPPNQKRARFVEPNEAGQLPATHTANGGGSSDTKKNKPLVSAIKKKIATVAKKLTVAKKTSTTAKVGRPKKTTEVVTSTPPKRSRKKPRAVASSTPSTTAESDDSQATIQITPLSKVIYTRTLKKLTRHYYDSVSLSIDAGVFLHKKPTGMPDQFSVAVGDVLAIQTPDSKANDFAPFSVEWSTAQVLAIWQCATTQEWQVHVRWFYRHAELDRSQKQRLSRKRQFDKQTGLLETCITSDCPLESVLPSIVDFGTVNKKSQQKKTKNGLPWLHVQCHHFQGTNGAIDIVHGWNVYRSQNIKSLPDYVTRGLDIMGPKELANRYRESISQRLVDQNLQPRDDGEDNIAPTTLKDDASTNTTKDNSSSSSDSLEVTPVSDIVYSRNYGRSTERYYYDKVEIRIDPGVFLKKPSGMPHKFAIQVGDIVAVQCNNDNDDMDDDDRNSIAPFCVEWGIAQLLAIYQNNKGEWHLQIRWFYRYHEMTATQKRLAKPFDQEHGLLETAHVTDDCPIESVLPAFIRFSPQSKKTHKGLPVVEFHCKHFDPEEGPIRSVDGWENYHANIDSLPDCLKRGLDLMQNKEVVKKYQECITNRDYDLDIGTMDESFGTNDNDNNRKRKKAPSQTEAGKTKAQKTRLMENVKVCSAVIHRVPGKHHRKYYQRVEVDADTGMFDPDFKTKFKISAKSFTISVGDIIAVQSEDDDDTIPVLKPFLVGWQVAQVISIYQTKREGWEIGIRKFYRYCELDSSQQEQVKELGLFSTSRGLLESMKMDECPISRALPAFIALFSAAEEEWARPELPSIKDGLPMMSFQCCHWQDENSTMHRISDWEPGFDSFSTLQAPLERGLRCLSTVVARKYRSAIEEGGADFEMQESAEDNEPTAMDVNDEDGEKVAPLQVIPVSSKPIYERWKRKFYDGIRVGIEPACMQGVYPRTRLWTIKVGYVVPIRYDQRPLDDDEARGWYPYVTGWNPAQVVSIYQEIDTGEWKMQIRWFNRYRDLGDEQRMNVDSLNESYVVFETEDFSHVSVASSLPGRVVLTSSPADRWDMKTSILTGLPILPRFCAHICVDEHVDQALDWNGYDLTLNSVPDPLTRGLLLSPANRENKDWTLMLSRYYKKFIRMRGTDPDLDIFRECFPQDGRLSFHKSSPTFESNEVGVSMGPPLEGTVDVAFHTSLKMTLPVKYVASPTKTMSKSKKSCFSCALGDVVCYYDTDAMQRPDSVLSKHMTQPWHPFLVPWSYGQILSIYRQPSGGASHGEICLEIRRFLRYSELPEEVQDLLPAAADDKEEVVESDSTIYTIPARRVLGKAAIYLGNHQLTASGGKSHFSVVASCRCRYFYLSARKRIQPLFCSGLSPQIWSDRLKERGYNLSMKIQESKTLRNAVALFEDENRTVDTGNLLLATNSGFNPEPLSFSRGGETECQLFKSAELTPKWSEFVQSELLYNAHDRNKKWKVQLGDFVALKYLNSSRSSAAFPFLTPWIPCRIAEIYFNGSEDGTRSEESLCFRLDALKLVTGAYFHQLIIPPEAHTREAKASDLLGPLVACTRQNGGCHIDWAKNQNHLPFAPVFVDDVLEDRHAMNPLETAGGRNETTEMEETKTRRIMPRAAWTTTAPFHVDFSQHRLYYSEFSLQNAALGSTGAPDESKEPWTLRMGDCVLVHCEGPKRFPLICNWGVAEIIAIWTRVQSRDEIAKRLHCVERTDSKVYVEMRWFYERQEIVGFHQAASIEETDELFETDHVDVIEAGKSVLVPANITADSSSLGTAASVNGVPIQSFFCRRFWSTKRKSLIPCGNQASRQKRGWLYSKHMTTEMKRKLESRDPLETIRSKAATDSDGEWKSSFNQVIRAMTLKEASKGAYERGQSLVGREKELDQLLSFMRSAIRGDAGAGGLKSSIFLAGPPGVGKTACIRAAVARLLNEPSNGKLPSFNFIPLNGMEMRHPFDAYVRLWEEVTGRKHVGPAEKACQKLEAYFTGSESTDPKSTTPKSISVVLLDEIDYLITSKQTVLYDFFDWPKRAAEMNSPRRLVVVGISNTLNLADQLLPSVQSRVGNERCTFKAYNLKDVVAILTAKIKEASPSISVFEDDAILFAAKKTAALSGDIRRAFQICRAAAELVLSEGNASTENNSNKYRQVKISDVQKASRESFNTALVTAVSFLTPFQALLLVTLATLCRTTGREVGGFDVIDVMTKMDAVAGAAGDPQYLPPPSFGETLRLLNSLGEYNLVTLRTATSTATSFRSTSGGSGGAWPLAALAVDEGTIIRGLRNTPHKPLAEKNLPPQF